jgi:anti-sigma B factor antagonist
MTTTLAAAVRHAPDGAAIELAGDLDSGAREALDRAFAEAAVAPGGALLLDFTAVEYISSSGIALIVGLLGRARADRVAVGACGLSEHYREIFEITRLSDFMSIYADADAARAARGGGA